MRTVLLATFHDLGPAQLLQIRLQRAGIQTTIHDDSRLQRFWFIHEPLAAIHLEVPRPEHQRATELLNEWDRADGVLKDAVRCPSCHSLRVEYPQMTRKFVTPSLGSLLMAVGLIPRAFYCCDCQYTWPSAVLVEAKRDVLGWPSESKLWHPEHEQRKN